MQESNKEQEEIANENEYEVDYCNVQGTGEQLLEMGSRRYNGHIRLSAEDWAKIPNAPEPTIEELQANPSSFNEVAARSH